MVGMPNSSLVAQFGEGATILGRAGTRLSARRHAVASKQLLPSANLAILRDRNTYAAVVFSITIPL